MNFLCLVEGKQRKYNHRDFQNRAQETTIKRYTSTLLEVLWHKFNFYSSREEIGYKFKELLQVETREWVLAEANYRLWAPKVAAKHLAYIEDHIEYAAKQAGLPHYAFLVDGIKWKQECRYTRYTEKVTYISYVKLYRTLIANTPGFTDHEKRILKKVIRSKIDEKHVTQKLKLKPDQLDKLCKRLTKSSLGFVLGYKYVHRIICGLPVITTRDEQKWFKAQSIARLIQKSYGREQKARQSQRSSNSRSGPHIARPF